MQAAGTQWLKGCTVVVVDDEPNALELTTMLLEMHGATVVAAADGEEGLEVIRKSRPRFVLSDISMPGMSGEEMVKRLKADRATAPIPIIAVTAHALKGDREWAINHGFNDYVAKPFISETFIFDVLSRLAGTLPEFASFYARA